MEVASYMVVVVTRLIIGSRVFYPLVLDPRKDPPFWKFPGGKSETVDKGDPIATAVREIWGETGLSADPDNLVFLRKEQKNGKYGPYMLYVYETEICSPSGFREIADEGEMICAFTPEGVKCLLTSKEFFPPYLPFFKHVRI